jgi:hypothetical protein
VPVNAPEPEQIEAEEVDRLIELATTGQLDTDAQKQIVPLLQTLVWLQQALLETRISLSRLRRILFGKPTESRPRKPKDPTDESADSAGEQNDTSDLANDAEVPAGDGAHQQGGTPWDTDTDAKAGSGEQGSTGRDTQGSTPRRGHGRLGAADYLGAETVFCAHDQLNPGDPCPHCQGGRLYTMPPLVRLKFTGQPPAVVTRYEAQRLRCAGCGAIIVATLPSEARGERYTVSLKVMLAIDHYYLGLPFKRIELLQNLVGMPLPDATQWALVEQLADSAYPVFEWLKRLGANQPLVYQDDTGARVLNLIAENQADPPPERKGIYTTVLRFEGEHSICLYFTGRRHAGENLDEVLGYRDPDLPPIQWMSDGLAANTPKTHKELTLEIHCTVHGRRNFVEIEDFFPDECAQVLDAIGKVYEHEAHCKDQALSSAQRLAYHQQHSAPVMAALKAWMQDKLEHKQVEPNSRLGGAFNYLLKRWESLTRFLSVLGAPLDNNCAERALKLILRYRNNSLFYKNAHGAYVGDVLTSLIETCRLASVNPFGYLSALMDNRPAVFRDPDAWLPWNYLDAGQSAEPQPVLSHSTPILGHPSALGVAVPQ